LEESQVEGKRNFAIVSSPGTANNLIDNGNATLAFQSKASPRKALYSHQAGETFGNIAADESKINPSQLTHLRKPAPIWARPHPLPLLTLASSSYLKRAAALKSDGSGILRFSPLMTA